MQRRRSIRERLVRVEVLALAAGIVASACTSSGTGQDAVPAQTEPVRTTGSTATETDPVRTTGSTATETDPVDVNGDETPTLENDAPKLRLLSSGEACGLIESEAVEAVMGPSTGAEPGPDTAPVSGCSWWEAGLLTAFDRAGLHALVNILLGTYESQEGADISASRTEGLVSIDGTDWAMYTSALPGLELGESLQAGAGLQYIWINLAPGPDGGDVDGAFELAVEIVKNWLAAAST